MATVALQTEAQVIELVELCKDNYRVRLACEELAKQILPGQFFMLRKPGSSDPLLGRPFALYDTVHNESGEIIGIDVGFHVVGKMTSLMEQLTPDDHLEIWGPLGNGFPQIQTKHLILVAGGIGYTPFVATSRQALLHKQYGDTEASQSSIQAEKASLIYGVRSHEFQADMSDLSDITELDIQVCTEDGSAGHHGLVTDLLLPLLTDSSPEEKVVFTCGPVRMMQAVAELCQKHNVKCWVSLETPMACGFGACFSCVVPTKQSDDQWDYRRSCLEGPVFPGEEILWGQM
ncbi:MAG: dihydroorotate dehydrogenase electron transfer subunit [Planctomycetaceae bacterium]|nr:dihydroorotate dehydrogenase electron transfer subunit [Planctomycetaceae bacterium]